MDTKLILLFVLQFLLVEVESLQCSNCSDVQDPKGCNSTIVCSGNEVCYTQFITSAGVMFNMGCQDNQLCKNNATLFIVGRHAERQSGDSCHECCSVDTCNKDLCLHKTPATCQDDPSFDCARISSIFDICINVKRAKDVCPKFCDLCCYADGNWISWTSWSTCDVTCANGTQIRHRSCTNPSPACGGDKCSGNSTQYKSCTERPCPVDGIWTVWGAWSDCDVTCATGKRTRTRACVNPAPAFGGLVCQGENIQHVTCIQGPCPVDGSWTPWNNWSGCDLTCANGTRMRTRTCTNPAPAYGGLYCPQNGTQNSQCFNDPCPIHGGWSGWSQWGICSVTCGVGLERRDRSCSNPHPALFGDSCYGDAHEDRVCMTSSCADGGWSQWNVWGNCPVTCGGGIRRRYRYCDNPRPSFFGTSCFGNNEETDVCGIVPCTGDSCSSNPCKNGGTCFENPYGFKCLCGPDFIGVTCDQDDHLPMDCLEIIEHPEKFTNKGDGVYKIRTWRSQTVLNVFCNMTFAQGGWTVFQRHDSRQRPKLDFSRNARDYEYGFGDPSSEHWLGLKFAEEMSSRWKNEVALGRQIESEDAQSYIALNVSLTSGPNYEVVVDDEYNLVMAGFNSTLTSGRFYTYDRDNMFNCAAADRGGWWYPDDFSYCYSNNTWRQPSFNEASEVIANFNHNGWLISGFGDLYFLDEYGDINEAAFDLPLITWSTIMFRRF